MYLPDAVNKLKENRWPIGVGVSVIAVANPLRELVAAAEPFLFNDYLESTQSSIVRVQQDQGKSC